MLALSRRETKLTISNKQRPPVSMTYMSAIILQIVGATSSFNKLNHGITYTPVLLSWASASVLLRSLFNRFIYCSRSETIRRFFKQDSSKIEHRTFRFQKYNSIELKLSILSAKLGQRLRETNNPLGCQ